MISLDPPYRLGAGQRRFVFNGWSEVDDAAAPAVKLLLNGVEVPVTPYLTDDLRAAFPHLKIAGFWASVDLRAVLPKPDPDAPFLLDATVRSGARSRNFEFAVDQAWLDEVFDTPPKPRAIPPEHLQIRVTGAAAGAFYATGMLVAEQIAQLVAAAGLPIQAYERVYDFGCGCGRVIGPIKDLHPSAKLSGSDIDAEAIAWCQGAMGAVADFRHNPDEPPTSFADESFDLIYSISIFTHLPEDLQFAWLAELRRLLRPGGVLLATTLNFAAYDLPAAVKAEGAAKGFVYWGEATATDGLPSFYRLAYHSHDYIRREWSRYFDIIRIGGNDLNNTQDSVLVRRRRDGT